MKKTFLTAIIILALVQTAPVFAAITSVSQISDTCLNAPATCSAEENAFLDSQKATQNSSVNNQGQAAQLNNQGLNASANPATQLPVAQPAPTLQPQTGGQGTNLGYTPLEPIPGITSGSFDITNPANLPKMISAIFTVLITLGALFSVAMLTISGLRYMLSDIVTDKLKAKLRIRASLYGLLLIAASWLILNTINPQLLNFTFYPGSGNATAAPTQNQTTGTAAGGGGGTAGPTSITVQPITLGQSTNVYSGPNAYNSIINLNSQCPGTMHQAGGGTDSLGSYVTWICQ